MSRLNHLQELLLDHPDDVELHYMLAMEYKSAGDHEAALAKFDDCIGLDSAYAPAYFHKGNTYLAMGRTPQAIETLKLGIDQATEAGDLHAAGEMSELLSSLG